MSNNIYLFANNNDGVAENFGYYRLYNMQMRGDSQGVQDGINYVEYLEGDGASWIDTGLITNENTQIEATVQLVTHENYKAWFGSDAINVGYQTDIRIPLIRLQGNSVTLNLSDNLNTGNLDKTVWKIDTSDVVVGEEIFVVDIDGRKWINFTPTENTNPTMSLKVFSGNFPAYSISETSNGCIKGRIYDFKVFMDNELRMHLRPCLDTEGVPCMYDEVSEEYFYNQGEGEFTYKDLLRDYQPVMDSNGVPCLVDKVNKKYYYGENDSLFSCKETDKKKSISYIKGDGNSYIDTGIYANPQYKYEIVFEDSDIQKYESLFGADQTECRVIRSIEQETLAFFYKGNAKNFNCSLNEKHTVTIRNYRVYMDGKHIMDMQTVDSTDTFSNPILIFNSYYGNKLDTIGTFKLYSFRMWDENDVLVFDGIPIIEGGVPYLYDRVSNRTLQNQGSGNFTYGIEKFTNGIVSDVPLEEISQSICDVIPTFAKMCDDGSYCMHGDRFVYRYAGLREISIEAYTKGKGLRLKPNTKYTIHVKTDAISQYSSVNPCSVQGYDGTELVFFRYNEPISFITDEIGRTFIYTYHDTNIYPGKFPFYIYLLEGDYVDYIKNNEVDFATSIDYLQADGTQYINTNVEINDSLDIDMECRPMVNNAGYIMNNTSLEGTYKYNETDTELTSNVSSESKTLTLGNTYGAMLTEEEEFSAYEQGWIIDGATANTSAVVSANTDISTLGTNETITSAYIELTNDNCQTRVDDILAYYPNCINVNLYDDGSVVSLQNFMSGERNAINQQVENVTFMEGYFRNVKNAENAFRWCTGLKTASNLPNSLEITGSMFGFCSSLETVTNIPTNVTDVIAMFYHSAIREVPPFPSNYTGKFESVFSECGNLIEAPIIPDGVTSMANCFMNCRNLTTVPNIPSSCTNFNTTFSGCTNLTSIPTDGWNGYMGYTFLNCTSLNQEINITNANTLVQAFKGCTSLSITPSIETDPTVASVDMGECFYGCTNLIIPPITPSNVKSMGKTYYGCTNLEIAPNIPSDVTYIAYALSNCKKIKEVTIPIGIIEVGNNYTGVIEGCSALENIDWDGNTGISLNLSLLLTGFAGVSERDFHELIARTTTGKWSSTTLILSDNYITMLTGGEIMNLTNKGWTIKNASSTSTVTVKSYETISKDMTISTTNENVAALVIELTSDNYKTRIDEILAYYPNVNDISFYDDGSVTSLGSMFGNHISSSGDYNNNRNHKNQITHMTFIDGYFENLVGLSSAFCECRNLLFVNNIPNNVTVMENTFRGCSGLIGISNIPTSVRHLGSCFHSCSSFNQMIDLSNVDIDNSIAAGSLIYLFYNCTSLTYTPILPSNYVGGVGGLKSTFLNCKALTEAPIIPSGVTNLNSCFSGCTSLTSVNTTDWDTSKVTDMANMFQNCNNLTSLDLSGFDTKNVTNMNGMFQNCSKLKTITGLGDLDTSNVTNIDYMFNNDSALETWGLDKWDTSKIETMQQTFRGSSIGNDSGIENWKLPNLKGLYYTFAACKNLTRLDISGWVTENTNDIYLDSTFYTNDKIEYINFENWSHIKFAKLSGTFSGCYALTEIKGIESFDTSEVTDMGGTFQNCTSLTSLDVSSFDTGEVTNMANMFNNCKNLTSLDVSGFDTSKVTNMQNMFKNCSKLTSLNVSNWSSDKVNTITPQLSVSPSSSTLYGTAIIDESLLPSGWIYDNPYEIAKYTANATGVLPTFNTDFTGYTTGEINNGDGTYTVSIATDSLDNLPTGIRFENNANLLTVTKLNISKLTSLVNLFFNCSNLLRVECAKDWDTSNITNFDSAFYQCSKLAELDVSNWNVDNSKGFWRTFYGCASLTTLDVSNWNTSQANNMANMFQNCNNLTSLDLSGLDTKNVTNMNGMFQNCKNLTSLDVSGFDTGKVTNTSNMFNGCNNLTSLDLSEFDTGKVIYMNEMFRDCSKLTSLDLSGFDTGEVTLMQNMFYGCIGLTSLDISNFDTSKVTNMSQMFYECTNLTSLDLSKWEASKVENMYETFRKCSSITELNLSGFTNVKDWGSFCRDCAKLVNITGLDISKYSTNFGGNNTKFLSFEGCTSLRNIKNLDVSFASAMAKAYSNSITDGNNYWIIVGWGWFNGLTNLADITFTGQLELYDTLSIYPIFRGCDTTKFTYATWNTFVSILPTTSTSKSIVMGKSQAILDAVPDEIKLALTQKGYTLTFQE